MKINNRYHIHCSTTTRKLSPEKAKTVVLYHIFVDLEKAIDKVPRLAIIWPFRRKKVLECLVRTVISLYTNSMSQVRFVGGLSEKLPNKIGVHQWSALSPLLFKLVMEEATKSIRKSNPCELLYADDLVLTAEFKEAVEDTFDAWSSAMELRGLKINIDKTKLMVSEKKN